MYSQPNNVETLEERMCLSVSGHTLAQRTVHHHHHHHTATVQAASMSRSAHKSGRTLARRRVGPTVRVHGRVRTVTVTPSTSSNSVSGLPSGSVIGQPFVLNNGALSQITANSGNTTPPFIGTTGATIGVPGATMGTLPPNSPNLSNNVNPASGTPGTDTSTLNSSGGFTTIGTPVDNGTFSNTPIVVVVNNPVNLSTIRGVTSAAGP